MVIYNYDYNHYKYNDYNRNTNRINYYTYSSNSTNYIYSSNNTDSNGYTYYSVSDKKLIDIYKNCYMKKRDIIGDLFDELIEGI